MSTYGEMTHDERVAAISERWLAGQSASVIAAALRAGRGAIIGMVHRNGLHKQRRDAVPKPIPGPRTAPVKARQPVAPRIVRSVPAPIPAWDVINSNRPPLPGVDPISILDLPNRPGVRCRFPVVGGYCGAPSGDHTYCETHRIYAYTPMVTK